MCDRELSAGKWAFSYMVETLELTAGRISTDNSLVIGGKPLRPHARLHRTIGGKVNMLLRPAGSMHVQDLVFW